jgi:hypothetical protein
MKILKIIESKHWVNKINGATASIYGSVPYTNDLDKENWHIITKGFTWLLDNGTVGLGRQAAKTLTEAQDVMKQFNERY